MDEIKEGILFYNLGTQKIDFSRIQNYFNIDTSKPVNNGTKTVAPNIANICWNPRTNVFAKPNSFTS